MKHLVIICLLLAGCTAKPQHPITEPMCLPCFNSDTTNSQGFRYQRQWSTGDWVTVTNCIPCSKARTDEQRFVCTGNSEAFELMNGLKFTITTGGGGFGSSAFGAPEVKPTPYAALGPNEKTLECWGNHFWTWCMDTNGRTRTAWKNKDAR